MRHSRLLAFAQLVRLPNVFTAFADICLGACAAGYFASKPGVFALMLLGSGCLYLAGMALNDMADRHDDAKHRPTRPIPSGRITPQTALMIAVGLLFSGLVLAGFSQSLLPPQEPGTIRPAHFAAALSFAIILYDTWLKRTPFGPVGMGLCRFLNVLLGISGAGLVGLSGNLPLSFHLAGVVGLYIVGVTWFARTEETDSRRWHLIGAAVVMAAAVLLGVTMPAHLEEGTVPVYFPYLLAVFAFIIGFPVVSAIRQPTPRNVQRAVKRCILGLVLLDAVLATAFVGWPGLLIGLLLLPAAWLGKWVYST